MLSILRSSNWLHMFLVLPIRQFYFAPTFHLTLQIPSAKSWLMMRNSPISEVLAT